MRRRHIVLGFAVVALVSCGGSNQGDSNGPGGFSPQIQGGGSSTEGGSTQAGSVGSDGSGGRIAGRGGATAQGGVLARGGATNASGAEARGGATAKGGAASSGGGRPAGGTSAVDCVHDGDAKTTLAFVNRCADKVTFAGSDIEGDELSAGATRCVDVGNTTVAISSKRYWGYAGEDPGPGKYSLAEFTFNTDFQDFDWYNISYVDAFNLPMQIVPVARPQCKPLTCAQDFLKGCPASGRFEKAAKLLACVNPSRNDGTNPVASYFETCDDAYAWSGDDQNGSDPSPVRACAGEDFEIVFCPAGSP